MPSTRSLAALPTSAELYRRCQSVALLDAVMSPEWEDRYYSFNSRWDEDEQLASMRNRSGDEWRAHFTPSGAILFGLDHESEAFRCGDPHPEILSNVPECFRESVMEPAFDTANISFCLWSEGGSAWSTGPIEALGDDGSESLLRILDSNPETYRSFASEYYGEEVDLEVIQRVYSHEPLTIAILKAIHSERSLEELHEDLEEIGYPIGS